MKDESGENAPDHLYCRKLQQQLSIAGVPSSSSLAGQSTLIDPSELQYEPILYVLFTNCSYDQSSLLSALEKEHKAETTQPEPQSTQLIEHHVGFMLSSPNLPDINVLKHIVDDCSDDLGEILNAIEHAVDQNSANLPTER